MEFIDLPIYIIYDILKYVPIKQLIKMEQTNKNFINIIRNGNWPHLVKIKSNAILIDIINKYKFINFNLSNSNVTDKSVKMLGNCHTLNLAWCKQITDESVKMLGKCHTLYLSGCEQI